MAALYLGRAYSSSASAKFMTGLCLARGWFDVPSCAGLLRETEFEIVGGSVTPIPTSDMESSESDCTWAFCLPLDFDFDGRDFLILSDSWDTSANRLGACLYLNIQGRPTSFVLSISSDSYSAGL
jgi:hypothetical protein